LWRKLFSLRKPLISHEVRIQIIGSDGEPGVPSPDGPVAANLNPHGVGQFKWNRECRSLERDRITIDERLEALAMHVEPVTHPCTKISRRR
jgi:hypothetical protein